LSCTSTPKDCLHRVVVVVI